MGGTPPSGIMRIRRNALKEGKLEQQVQSRDLQLMRGVMSCYIITLAGGKVIVYPS